MQSGGGIASNGTWGDHPLVVSLANTADPLDLVNRSGSRPSHEQDAGHLDGVIALRRRGWIPQGRAPGRHRLHPDEAPEPLGPRRGRFAFGDAAMSNLGERAEGLAAESYGEPDRPPRYEIKTMPAEAGSGKGAGRGRAAI